MLASQRVAPLCVVATCVVIVFLYVTSVKSYSFYQVSSVESKCSDNTALTPVRIHVNDQDGSPRDLFYLSPSCTKRPRGLMVLLHGCGRRSASFFYSPEGRIIVRAASRVKKYAVLAVAKREDTGCWDMAEADAVAFHIQTIRSDRGLQHVPLFGFGASSGGGMIGALTSHIPFCAVNIQISPLKNDLGVVSGGVIYTWMKKDASMLKFSEVMKPVLESSGKIGRLATLVIETPKIGKSYFSDKIEGVSPSSSEIFYKALGKAGRIDFVLNELKGNPRDGNGWLTGWDGVVPTHAEWLTAKELQDAKQIGILEELNVLANLHEITGEQFETKVLAFMENMRKRFGENVPSAKHP